jgi:hypothetical protein
MPGATKSRKFDQEDQLAIRQELEQALAKNVSVPVLAREITRLLKSLGRQPGTAERVACYLAEKLAPRFTRKSQALQTLIKDRWKELSEWVDLAAWEEVKAKALPIIEAQKKVRRKIKTQIERLRRNKRAKNRYERRERNYVTKPGAIERDFSRRSALSLLENAPPTGPCLDGIFNGGRVKMSGIGDSLQRLFGLSRKRLSMARPALRRGREIFYDYWAVLACMDALLKQTGANAYWLADAALRQTVLNGILFRARQIAKPRIRKKFEKTLLPYVTNSGFSGPRS